MGRTPAIASCSIRRTQVQGHLLFCSLKKRKLLQFCFFFLFLCLFSCLFQATCTGLESETFHAQRLKIPWPNRGQDSSLGEQKDFPNLSIWEFAKLCLGHVGKAYLTFNLMIQQLTYFKLGPSSCGSLQCPQFQRESQGATVQEHDPWPTGFATFCPRCCNLYRPQVKLPHNSRNAKST